MQGNGSFIDTCKCVLVIADIKGPSYARATLINDRIRFDGTSNVF